VTSSDEAEERIVIAEEHFKTALWMLIKRHLTEYTLTYEQVLGCMEMVKLDVYMNARDDEDEYPNL